MNPAAIYARVLRAELRKEREPVIVNPHPGLVTVDLEDEGLLRGVTNVLRVQFNTHEGERDAMERIAQRILDVIRERAR